MDSHTDVTSFVMRFTQETWVQDGRPRRRWRGLIKHVQSDAEQPFTQFADAVRFIARYVELDESTTDGSLPQLPKG